MAALTQARMGLQTKYNTVALPFATGLKAWLGGAACIDTAASVVKPAAAGNATLLKIGEFSESVDNSAGTATVMVLVNLDKEVSVRWYDNATGAAAVVAATLFGSCYWLDDHTVSVTSAGNAIAGRVWAIDPIKGVAVQTVTTGF